MHMTFEVSLLALFIETLFHGALTIPHFVLVNVVHLTEEFLVAFNGNSLLLGLATTPSEPCSHSYSRCTRLVQMPTIPTLFLELAKMAL